MSSFTTSVLESTASVIVIAGVQLSSTTTVRNVRFEQSATCTAAAISANNVVVPSSSSSDVTFSTLSVTLAASGLSAGDWSVCVDWAASPVAPSFLRVGVASSFVRVGQW